MKVVISPETKSDPVNYNVEGWSVGKNDAVIADALFQGTNGNDTIVGTSGDDLIRGYGGNDVMYGGDGNDRFAGYSGDDIAFGGNGIDTFFAGNGFGSTLTATGGKGADHFVMSDNSMPGANHPTDKLIIKDYVSGVDIVDIISHDNSINFSKFDTNGDGKLSVGDHGVTAYTNSEGVSGIQFNVAEHSVIQVDNVQAMSARDFSFTVI